MPGEIFVVVVVIISFEAAGSQTECSVVSCGYYRKSSCSWEVTTKRGYGSVQRQVLELKVGIVVGLCAKDDVDNRYRDI